MIPPSAIDKQGHRFYVFGCFDLDASFIADSTGAPAPAEGRIERGIVVVKVLRTPDSAFFVLDDIPEDEPC
jgi:hypothetical protein